MSDEKEEWSLPISTSYLPHHSEVYWEDHKYFFVRRELPVEWAAACIGCRGVTVCHRRAWLNRVKVGFFHEHSFCVHTEIDIVTGFPIIDGEVFRPLGLD